MYRLVRHTNGRNPEDCASYLITQGLSSGFAYHLSSGGIFEGDKLAMKTLKKMLPAWWQVRTALVLVLKTPNYPLTGAYKGQ
jgi:hypothetical protein